MRTTLWGSLLLATLVGCGFQSSDRPDSGPFGRHNDVELLEPFQGEWTVSEDRTFDVWRRQGKAAQIEQTKEFRKRFAEATEKESALARGAMNMAGLDAALKQLHPDLSITGDTFVGHGFLAQEYRLFAIHQHGPIVCAKAWFHEDRHDPGDMSKCWIRLERVKDEFHFHVKMQDDDVDIEKDPDLTSMPTLVDATSCEVAGEKTESQEWTTFVYVRPTQKGK
jgi:hypothetical protein